jgi:hypothetical protein
LGQKIGGFFDQGGGKLRVVFGLRELKKRCRLTQEILSGDHRTFPVFSSPTPIPLRGNRGFVPVEN